MSDRIQHSAQCRDSSPCPRSVLVVDDDESIHWSVTSILFEYRNIDIEHAYSIHELRQRIKERYFQFVFLDIHLPDGDGLNEVGWIRARQPACQIVPLTVEKNLDYAAQRSRVGVDGWIPKGHRLPSHLVRKVVFEGDALQQTHGNLLRVPIPRIEKYPNMSQTLFVFESRSDLLDHREQRFLRAFVESMLQIPKGEASEEIADRLKLSPSSLTEYLERIRLPPFCDLKRAVASAAAIVMQWRNPATGVEGVVASVSSYHPRSLAGIISELFDVRLEQVARSPALIGYCAGPPVPVYFIHGRQPPEWHGDITVHIVVRG
jgi:DNA-binding NarL/FixJ family response regulator